MARKMKTMDGNQAAAHASYAYTDVAAIYPIKNTGSRLCRVENPARSPPLSNIPDGWNRIKRLYSV